MSAITCFRWRNYISFAPDLMFTSKMNSSTNIDLKEYLIQGANPVDMDVINEKQFQGAFRLNYFCIEAPKFGRLEPGLTGTGWRYYPNKDFVGEDEFKYVLNNGSQNSNEGTVRIKVNPGLSGTITVYKAVDRPYWKLYGESKYDKAKFGTFDLITYTWLMKKPFRVYENGEPYIYEDYHIIQTTGLHYDQLTNYPTITDLRDDTDWLKFTWPDPNLSGYLPNTVQPYVQPLGPFPLTLKIDYFSSPMYEDIIERQFVGGYYRDVVVGTRFIYFKKHEIVEIEVTRDKGDDWYKNGLVVLVTRNNPDYPSPLFYP